MALLLETLNEIWFMTDMRFQLFDQDGQRKYLTAQERQAFLAAAEHASREVRTLCMELTFSGCRLSEALALTADRVDLDARTITFETLKKRRKGVYRAVPVPASVIDALNLVHALREAKNRRGRGKRVRLWAFSRTSGWRHVCAVMTAAGIDGPQASPKGLRHGFGVQAVTKGKPLNMVQKWLGHAQLSTTAIYADAIGAEEHQMIADMWED